MSPSRARSRRTPVRRARPRREVVTAVLGAAAVVGLTVLAIWMLRPGDPLTPGTGGLAHRQPRVTWLIATAVVIAIVALVVIRRSPRLRRRAAVAIPVAAIAVLAGVIVAGVVWPSGLLRHYVSAEPPEPIQSTTVPRPTTTRAGATSTSAGTTATTTTTPSASTTTPTTGG